jgi:hypothetical protein
MTKILNAALRNELIRRLFVELKQHISWRLGGFHDEMLA